MSQISEYFRSIFFPNLGITLRNIGDHINIGSFEVRFYGIIIMIGFLLAYVLVTNEAKIPHARGREFLPHRAG